MYKCVIKHLPSLIHVVRKPGATSPNIRKTQMIPIGMYVIKFVCYDRYEKKRETYTLVSSDIGGTELTRLTPVLDTVFQKIILKQF